MRIKHIIGQDEIVHLERNFMECETYRHTVNHSCIERRVGVIIEPMLPQDTNGLLATVERHNEWTDESRGQPKCQRYVNMTGYRIMKHRHIHKTTYQPCSGENKSSRIFLNGSGGSSAPPVQNNCIFW